MKQTVTVKQIQAFEEYLCENEKSRATVEKYVRDIHTLLDYVGEREITKETVLAYKELLGSRYAVTSANSMLAAINHYFRFCGCSELCVRQFKVQRSAFCSADKELSREEYKRLVKVAEQRRGGRLSLMLQTICGTGIRVSELANITVEAVQKGRSTGSCKGKTRTVLIIPILQKKLLRYAKEYKIRSGAIFVTGSGKPINRSTVWREMKALCKEACVPPQKVFPHNLRHLFARTFYHLEKDIAKLADILGHSSINTTRIYITTTGEEHLRRMEHMHLIL